VVGREREKKDRGQKIIRTSVSMRRGLLQTLFLILGEIENNQSESEKGDISFIIG